MAVAMVATGCENDGDAERSPSTDTAEIDDPTGDTELYNQRSRPSDVTVNVDVDAQKVTYGEDGLAIEVVYAEPLDPDQEPAELLTSLQRQPLDGVTLWWRDTDARPFITGEDDIRTGCRVPRAEVDRREGRVVLVVPATERCLGPEPPPELTLEVTAYRGGTWDRLRSVKVKRPELGMIGRCLRGRPS